MLSAIPSDPFRTQMLDVYQMKRILRSFNSGKCETGPGNVLVNAKHFSSLSSMKYFKHFPVNFLLISQTPCLRNAPLCITITQVSKQSLYISTTLGTHCLHSVAYNGFIIVSKMAVNSIYI